MNQANLQCDGMVTVRRPHGGDAAASEQVGHAALWPCLGVALAADSTLQPPRSNNTSMQGARGSGEWVREGGSWRQTSLLCS